MAGNSSLTASCNKNRIMTGTAAFGELRAQLVNQLSADYVSHHTGDREDVAHVGALLWRVALPAAQRDEDEQRRCVGGDVLDVVTGAGPRLAGRDPAGRRRSERLSDEPGVERNRHTTAGE